MLNGLPTSKRLYLKILFAILEVLSIPDEATLPLNLTNF